MKKQEIISMINPLSWVNYKLVNEKNNREVITITGRAGEPVHKVYFRVLRGALLLRYEGSEEYQIRSRAGNAPDDAQVWVGRGYTGGHVSQAHWDTDQEYRQSISLLQQGYFIKNITVIGLTGTYRPKVLYWK
jgi:hypothetical protein